MLTSDLTWLMRLRAVLRHGISFVLGLWSLVIGVIAVRQVLDYSSTGRAIIVCLIAGVICWIVVAILLLPLLAMAAVTHAVTS